MCDDVRVLTSVVLLDVFVVAVEFQMLQPKSRHRSPESCVRLHVVINVSDFFRPFGVNVNSSPFQSVAEEAKGKCNDDNDGVE